MGLRGLNDLKKVQKNKTTTVYKRFLFIGEDFYTINLLNWFLENHPQQDICLANHRKIEKENLIFMGPGMVRGEENIKLWKKYIANKIENSELQAQEVSPLFFKDQDFRSFDGRHRPQVIMPDEEYFLGKSLRTQKQSVEKYYFDGEQAKLVASLDLINSVLKQTQIVSINRQKNSDFISPINFEVELASGETVTCEHLFFGLGPFAFLELFKDKKNLSNEAIEFCEKAKPKHALLVRFYLAKKLSEKEETLYIPYSVTNELGHVVVEFNESRGEKFKNATCEQYLDCLLSLDPEATDEESISRNIRTLRKNLERVFPGIEKNILSEFMMLNAQMGCRKIDDLLFQKASENFKNVYLLGENAPLAIAGLERCDFEDSDFNVSMLVRGVLGGEQIQQLFSKN